MILLRLLPLASEESLKESQITLESKGTKNQYKETLKT